MPDRQSSKSRFALISVATALAMLPATNVLASHGPGAAGAVTQLAMAIIFYAASAAVIANGLIGALRDQ
jgi:hypothetical protein